MADTKRGYLTIEELEDYANITVTDEDEALDQIDQAEELVDAYVGVQNKFLQSDYFGQITAISNSNKTFADTRQNSQLGLLNNYFQYATLDIIGGAGSGQSKRIVSSNKDNKTVTIEVAFTITPDTTSVFRIYQLGKFPRREDASNQPDPLTYNKYIPEAIKRATAAQVEYIINQGNDFFASDQTDKDSEHIGNYSYTKGGGNSGGSSNLIKMTAPKVRALLKGFKNSKGRLSTEQGTWH